MSLPLSDLFLSEPLSSFLYSAFCSLSNLASFLSSPIAFLTGRCFIFFPPPPEFYNLPLPPFPSSPQFFSFIYMLKQLILK